MQTLEKLSASSSSPPDCCSISGNGNKEPEVKSKDGLFLFTCFLVCLLLTATYKIYDLSKLNQVLALDNVITKAENRILKDEVTELDRRPTYENGYKDALIRKGGPNDKGDYQNGWEDAMKLATKDSTYADGYHQAIQQYGYQKTSEYLVSEPMQSASK